MASMLVKHLLAEIARLSPQEQEELLDELLQVLHQEEHASGLRLSAVQEAIATRERIRRHAHDQHRSLGSVAEDLEAVRYDRLSDLGSTGDERLINTLAGREPRVHWVPARPTP